MVLEATNKSLENEILFRKGIEYKINEMNGIVIQSKSNENNFKKKYETLQNSFDNLKASKDSLVKEVVELRSFKEKAFLKYADYDVQLANFKQQIKEQKDKQKEAQTLRQKAELTTASKATIIIGLENKIRE